MSQPRSIDNAPPNKRAEGASKVERLLEDARRRLVETGTRNRLVHTPRSSKRTRSFAIASDSAESVFATLVRNGKTIRFVADGGVDDPSALRTTLSQETLEKRLLAIYRDAKTAEDEQGINILFIALGFLQWFETSESDVKREAPLILLPVLLVRDPRRSTFDLRIREDDIATNQALQERLGTDFGISLPEIPDDDEWRPYDYFKAVRVAIAGKTNWTIDEEGIELGFYSFAKLLMIRDLEPNHWANESILDHPLLRGLLTDGFSLEPPVIPDGSKLDQLFAPADLIHVVDADASQTIVIETVRAGRNLVVQGPPGTGKSQTITNIIAAAVHDGKTVLFVAEKMPALNVVHDRLRKVGLSEVCLELHSRSGNKRLVAEELGRTLTLHAAEPSAAAEAERLVNLRDGLNEVSERLHASIGTSDLSPYQTLSWLIAASDQGIAAESGGLAEAAGWDASTFLCIQQTVKPLADRIRAAGPRNEHPYFGVRSTSLHPLELARLGVDLNELVTAANGLADQAEPLVKHLLSSGGLTLRSSNVCVNILREISAIPAGMEDLTDKIVAGNPVRIAAVAATGVRWQDIRARYLTVVRNEAWEISADPLKAGISIGVGSFFGRLRMRYRKASSKLAALLNVRLPSKAVERLAIVDALIGASDALDELQREDAAMAKFLGSDWRLEKTDFPTLLTVSKIAGLLAHESRSNLQFVHEVVRRKPGNDEAADLTKLIERVTHAANRVLTVFDLDIRAAFGESSLDDVDVRTLAARAGGWSANRNRFDEWSRLDGEDQKLRRLGAPILADGLATGRISAHQAVNQLMSARCEAIWKQAVSATPHLRDFFGDQHQELINEFKSLEIKRRSTNVAIVRGRHAARIPRGNLGAMNVVRAEIGRKRGHKPIRKLMQLAGETIQRIKPVFLMSPISVAQFLPPGSATFDLLVIDEASQVRPEDALGLVARAKQLVVVGDQKQLPPTSFFDRMMTEEIELDDTEDAAADTALAGAAKATELESILSLCEARGLESQMLRWHYRSRHPSLIEVSNAEFYKHLIMPPAPSRDRKLEGLILQRVKGAYDRGGKRVNTIEAEAIADAVAVYARNSEGLSLGVVTFSTAQRDEITHILDTKRRDDPALDAFLIEGKKEETFVKNLENVQGDERDVILISVGYGPRLAGGKLDSQAFGPVSTEGGERRLNVLFTRARSRCEVFVSFSPGDIVPDRSAFQGPRILKRFLQYADTGRLEEQDQTAEDFDSAFEQAVACAIETLGYRVDKQVGSAGFKIDLAVSHPDDPSRYILAVECDGASYHNALWARERDRLRQEVLENLGWRFLRIWSTDWFYRRGSQISKLKNALDEALRLKPISQAPEPAIRATPLLRLEPFPELNKLPAYKMATLVVPSGLEPHEVPLPELVTVVHSIVNQEGPIHQDEVTRRVAALFGKGRTGSRIADVAQRALAEAPELVKDGAFWMTTEQKIDPPVRDRSNAALSLQRADMLPPTEIKAAIKIAVEQNGSIPDEEIPTAVARMFGFQRTGPDLRAVILKARSEMD